jgi:phospholipid/cholesterol/gamma-HCH transport system substrate-binding protein
MFMDKSFKFRRVNELIGAFVMVTVALLVTGILLAGRAQQWFEPEYELRINFPIEGSFGLQKGAEVTVLGTPVGTVKQIDLVEKNRLQAVLKIRGNYVDFIKTDSIAVIKRKLGVAGDAFIDVTAGENGAPIARTGVTILDCRKDAELMEMVQSVLEQVQQSALPVITELQKTLMEYRLLAADIRDPEGNLQQILVQARGTLSQVDPLLIGIEKGEGTVGLFLKDPATASHIETILNNVKMGSAVLPEAANTIRDELRDVPGVVLQTRATLHESEKLLQGVQQHWLIRGYIQENQPLDAIPLDAVQGGRSGKVSQ